MIHSVDQSSFYERVKDQSKKEHGLFTLRDKSKVVVLQSYGKANMSMSFWKWVCVFSVYFINIVQYFSIQSMWWSIKRGKKYRWAVSKIVFIFSYEFFLISWHPKQQCNNCLFLQKIRNGYRCCWRWETIYLLNIILSMSLNSDETKR